MIGWKRTWLFFSTLILLIGILRIGHSPEANSFRDRRASMRVRLQSVIDRADISRTQLNPQLKKLSDRKFIEYVRIFFGVYFETAAARRQAQALFKEYDRAASQHARDCRDHLQQFLWVWAGLVLGLYLAIWILSGLLGGLRRRKICWKKARHSA